MIEGKLCNKKNSHEDCVESSAMTKSLFAWRRIQLQSFLESETRPRVFSTRCAWTGKAMQKITLFDGRNGTIRIEKYYKNGTRLSFIVIHGMMHDYITEKKNTEKFIGQCCDYDSTDRDDEEEDRQLCRNCTCSCWYCTQQQAKLRSLDIKLVQAKIAARTIQKYWRRAVSAPDFVVCRKRLRYELSNL